MEKEKTLSVKYKEIINKIIEVVSKRDGKTLYQSEVVGWLSDLYEAEKQSIKRLKESPDFDEEDKRFIDKIFGKELTKEI